MSKNLWLCVPLVSVGLLGCATPPAQRVLTDQRTVEAVGCTPGRCVVNVWIADCEVAYSSIMVDPVTLYVPERGLPKNIRWQIASEGYIFASDGIVITNPDGEFNEPALGPNGEVFKWKNKHSANKSPKTYKYTVKVIKTGEIPRNCFPYDPFIANE